MRAIITSSLYIFYPLFEVHLCDLWPYVWLVFKSGFYSRAGYSGACTVYKRLHEFISIFVNCMAHLLFPQECRMLKNSGQIFFKSYL